MDNISINQVINPFVILNNYMYGIEKNYPEYEKNISLKTIYYIFSASLTTL